LTRRDKPLAWLHAEITTPPFTVAARFEIGFLLRRLQRGGRLSLPHSRPVPSIGRNCHELRVTDVGETWRLIYRIDTDAIVILEIFAKKTARTPQKVVDVCRQRLKRYDDAGG
jgi:phage-related protein